MDNRVLDSIVGERVSFDAHILDLCYAVIDHGLHGVAAVSFGEFGARHRVSACREVRQYFDPTICAPFLIVFERIVEI